MHWGNLALLLVRAVGALAGAAAGIAALLTDGAFEKREQPLVGWWKDFPFAKYRVTRWGGTLLAVILVAPMVQFVGDWMKDSIDAQSQEDTAKKIREDIKSTVKGTTEKARNEIVTIVQSQTILQAEAESKVLATQNAISAQVSDVVVGAGHILKEVDRNLFPLVNVRVTYSLIAPLEAPEFATYRDRLIKGIEEILKADNGKSTNGYISHQGPSGPESVSISRNSPLMPQRAEVIPFYLLRYSGLRFSFFRIHHSDSELVANNPKSRPRPDLMFTVSTETGGKGSDDLSLEYDLKSHQLRIEAFDLFSDPQDWITNNQIMAVPDLSNTQLTLRFDETMVLRLPIRGQFDDEDQALSRLRNQMKLESVILKLNTRELWIKGRNRGMKRLSGSGTRPFTIYTTAIPKSVDDLQLR